MYRSLTAVAAHQAKKILLCRLEPVGSTESPFFIILTYTLTSQFSDAYALVPP